MGSFTTTAKNTMLDALTVTHASLHSADPGATGTNELAGGSPAYARKAVTVNAAAIAAAGQKLADDAAPLSAQALITAAVGDKVAQSAAPLSAGASIEAAGENGGEAQAAASATMAGGVTPEDVARIRRFLKREKEPITKLYKKLVRVKRYVPDATREQLVKVAAQYSTDAKPLTLDWLNFEAIMRAGDQERVKALINNAILAAEIAQADDDDDEDTLLLLYA